MLGKPVSDFSSAAAGVLYFHPFEEILRFPFELTLESMYGKNVRGTGRSTSEIDENGVPAHEWRGVKVPGHAQEVLNFVKAL